MAWIAGNTIKYKGYDANSVYKNAATNDEWKVHAVDPDGFYECYPTDCTWPCATVIFEPTECDAQFDLV